MSHVNYPATTSAASASAASRRSRTEHTMISSFEKVSIDDGHHHQHSPSSTTSSYSSAAMSDTFDEIRDVRGGVVYRSLAFLESKPSSSSHLTQDHSRKQYHYSESIDNKQTFKLPQTDQNHPGFVVFNPLNTKDAKPVEKKRSTQQQQQQQIKQSIKALPIPILLEKNSNVLVTGSLSEIADSVTELLHKHGVDISFKPEKCKWIGVAYAHNRELSLRIFLYKAPSTAISNSNESDNSTKEHYILEFQRREGSAMDFSSLYQEIYQDLLKTGFVVTSNGANHNVKQYERKSNRVFAPPPFPQCLCKPSASSSNENGSITQTSSPSSDLKSEDFASLIGLTQSKYIETQRESLRTVANMVCLDIEKRRVLGSSSDLLETLVDNLISTDAEVCRLSCSALESFSKEADIATKLAKFGLMHRVCQILASPRVTVCSKSCKAKSTREGFSRETRRLASRIAFNMVTHMPDILHKVSGSQVLFRSLGSSEDEDKVVKEMAISIVQRTATTGSNIIPQ